ncbi:MAG: hypothetical protein V3S24_03180, partial [Candidatus Tectomicrobia bacterium]
CTSPMLSVSIRYSPLIAAGPPVDETVFLRRRRLAVRGRADVSTPHWILNSINVIGSTSHHHCGVYTNPLIGRIFAHGSERRLQPIGGSSPIAKDAAGVVSWLMVLAHFPATAPQDGCAANELFTTDVLF